jgi:hypothetical protein
VGWCFGVRCGVRCRRTDLLFGRLGFVEGGFDAVRVGGGVGRSGAGRGFRRGSGCVWSVHRPGVGTYLGEDGAEESPGEVDEEK